HFGGHDFFADGSAAICTMEGDVWRVEGLDATLAGVRWRRIAAGLHHALGVVVADGAVYVLGRDQITRLVDVHGAGETDFYEGPRDGRPPALPLAYLPRGLDHSSGGQVYVLSDKWGPLRGQRIHLSYGAATHFLLLRDEVGGQPQGAVVPLAGDFASGVHRG